MRTKLLFLLFLAFLPYADAAITSYDNVFTTNDVYSADFPARLNENFSKSLTGGINNISSANIVGDTVAEVDMADDANPRIRTYEGAGCEFVYTGLVPATSGTLSTTISAGTAYPLGYRINKASATNKTFSSSLWTWVDLDINGDFQYPTAAIGGATPSVSSNSIRLARVSTDSTTVVSVVDLRTTSCSTGALSDLSSTTGSLVDLNEILRTGQPVRRFSQAGRTPQGFAQGGFVSWDTHTTFKVSPGSLYINGVYRISSTDVTVPQTADAPATSVSGIDTGAIAGSTRYYVYAVADQDAVENYSISFSTSATNPNGVTNYRLLGSILTDGSSLFTSRDVSTVHGLSEREVISTWVTFNGTAGTLTIADGMNVASLTDNGTGDYTITFDIDYPTANYVWFGSCTNTTPENPYTFSVTASAAGSKRVGNVHSDGTVKDCHQQCFMVLGDTRS